MNKFFSGAILSAAIGILPFLAISQHTKLQSSSPVTSMPTEGYSVLPWSAPTTPVTLVSKYGSSKEYDWNDTTSTWTYAEEGRFKYDSRGNLVARYYLAPTSLDSLGRVLYSYDAAGNQTWRGSYNYDPGNGTWVYVSYDSSYYDTRRNNLLTITRYYSSVAGTFVNSLQVVNVYDSFGNRTETRTDSWSATAIGWETVTGRKTAYTYTPQGYPNTILTSAWNSNNQVYDDRERDTILVNAAGVPTGYYAYLMTANGFRLRLKYDSLQWYEYTSPLLATSKPSRYIIQGRGLGVWTDSLRSISTYGSTGSYTILTQNRTLAGWQPLRRQYSNYDQNGLYTGFRIETYSASAGSFRGLVGFNRVPTYATNGIDLLEIINQNWDGTNQSWKNSTRAVYTDFTQLTSLASTSEHGNLKVYPNPASCWVNVKTTAGLEGSMRLTNALGQLVYAANINGESVQMIDLDGLPKGIYYLEVQQSGQANRSAKLIVH